MQELKQATANRTQSGQVIQFAADPKGRGSKGLSDPVNTRAYGAAWLAQQCRRIAGAKAALLVIRFPGAAPLFIAWPVSEGSEDLVLARLTDQAFAERKTVVAADQSGDGPVTERSAPQGGTAIAVPLGVGDQPVAVVAVALAAMPRSAQGHDLSGIAEDLRWGAGWLEALPWVQRGEATRADLMKALACLDLLAASGDQPTLLGTAMAVANELAVRFSCERASVGLGKPDGSVRLLAISHSATFKSNARLVAAIETAMEEAVEQRATVTYPPQPTGERVVVMAQGALAEQASNPDASVMSLILASGSGKIVGAITLERHAGPAFDQATLQMAEAMAALLGPVVALHARSSRLVAGRLIDNTRTGLATLLGPRRPVRKLAAIALVGVALTLALAQGEHRVSARSFLEPEIQRAAVAPFDGFIAAAPVRAGDTVKSKDLLAKLDDRDLLLDRAKWSAERDKLVQKQREALAKHDRSALVVLGAQIQQALSQLALVEERLARVQVLAPFDGVIVSGDLSQMLGSPIEKGKVLFEVAPLTAYRIILQVDERDIGYVVPDQKGTVALAGIPSTALPLVVTRITPVAVAEDGRNTFRIEARLTELDPRIRPGLEGVAKLDAGQRSLLWIWTRSLIDWLRLAAWRYLP